MAKRRPTRPNPQSPQADATAASSGEATPLLQPESGDRVGGNAVHLLATRDDGGWRRWLGALLFLAVLGVFLPALRHEFITYDDPAYVVNEPHVNTGLSWDNFRWAWTSFEHSNWHPLTWLSHQLDCTLFGLQPWGHHLTNSLLHAASALVLFVWLRRANGFVWRSLAVAALFGLHPLRVESVAWIAERKDVLSVFLGMLTLWAYVAYAQRRATKGPRAGGLYAVALTLFALGLTAKPMLVTLPCVLLLLDLWPLRRADLAAPRTWLGLVAEKLPFFALAVVSCVLTAKAQAAGGAVKTLEDFTLWGRAANALLAYAQYLGKLFWPAKLAVLYPNFGEQPPAGQLVLAGALLLTLTAGALFALRRGRPWALVGWLWFLGTLVPVIGFVQVGGQTMADRYSYLPSIGVLLALVWLVAEGSHRLPRRTLLLGAAAGVALLVCIVLTSLQLRLWQNSVTLFRHTIAVTENNWMAHYNLSVAYGKSSTTAYEAREEFRKMAAILAAFAERYNQRGLALQRKPGRGTEALAAFEKAIRIKGDEPAPRLNLGRALRRIPGREEEAVAHLRAVLRFDPENGEALLELGRTLAALPGQLDEGIKQLRLALLTLPETAEVRSALASALARDPRRRAAAIAEFEKALALDPNYAEAKAGLAQLRASGH